MRTPRPLLILLGLAALVGSGNLACSGNEEPDPLPSQAVSQVTPQLQPPPPAPPPIREVAPTRGSTVKVIDSGTEVGDPLTLAEASQLAKARKAESRQEPVAKITDENLHEYSEGAAVIVLESEPAARLEPFDPGGEGDDRLGSPGDPESTLQDSGRTRSGASDLRGEDYWRTRALELRMGWRRTVDRIQELELQAAALRQQFYAEEDPYIRDSQLKPAWDRVLDRVEDLRERSTRYEQDLDLFVEEGRRAGALQGWLNQGWELEPTPEEQERVRQVEGHQAIDPPVLEEDGR